ncbi:MAG TPA: patatin-like phospholipase family protein [Actinomycetota bacterium]|nr:patatin-like phospholipase family protein [Actinomycetota bacterium]
MNPNATELRLSLTLAGAVSLGSYEAGALAALVGAAQQTRTSSGPHIVIDSIAGASAGSVTAILTAYSLLTGADPVKTMWSGWVDAPDIKQMISKSPVSPLSTEFVEQMARGLLKEVPISRSAQTEPVRLSMALGNLQGLGYEIRQARSKQSLDAMTFIDWAEFTVSADATDGHVYPWDLKLLDFALASSANPLGFPPRGADRTQDVDTYKKNGVLNFPDSRFFWYTDGGMIDNEPLGRTIDLANTIDKSLEQSLEYDRILLLIHPHPQTPKQLMDWTQPDGAPSWAKTFIRADQMSRSQSLYDDLRRLEKSNSRIRWLKQVKPLLERLLKEANESQSSEGSAAVDQVLQAARHVREEKASLKGRVATGELTDRELLESLLNNISGLEGKREFRVEVISPSVLAKKEPVDKLLAGEFLLHFGDFSTRNFAEVISLSDTVQLRNG